MEFSKGRHWSACVAGVVALFCWITITRLFWGNEPMQHDQSCLLSSMYGTAFDYTKGFFVGWISAFLAAHLILQLLGWQVQQRRALIPFLSAVAIGTIAILSGLRIEQFSIDGLIRGVYLNEVNFAGALIGWNSGIAAAFTLTVPGEGWSFSPLRAFVIGLIVLAYIGAEGMSMGESFAEYDPWHGRSPQVSPWTLPAAFFAYGLLAGWILPFLARWRLNVSALWFALAGIIGLAVLYGTGWGVSSWPPGTGRWVEPHLMSGFWPPFTNGIAIGLTLGGIMLLTVGLNSRSGNQDLDSGRIERTVGPIRDKSQS